jgi:exosortase/archaeosortase family protein
MNILRSHLYSGLVVVGFANGASDRIASSVGRDGAATALLNMLGVSLVVWAAGAAVLSLLLRAKQHPVQRMDIAVAAAASMAFLLPVPQLSWLALTGTAVWLAVTTADGPTRRAAILLGAITVPMFWARLLFAVLSGPILAIDAKLVGWIVGTQSDRNAIPFADGSGVLFLEPACSSLTNVSLAMLCGVLVVKLYDQAWSPAIVRTIFAACAATVAINVVRISLIGILPAYYDVIHGPVGATLAEWTANFAVVAIYAGAMRSNAPVHA